MKAIQTEINKDLMLLTLMLDQLTEWAYTDSELLNKVYIYATFMRSILSFGYKSLCLRLSYSGILLVQCVSYYLVLKVNNHTGLKGHF